MSLWEILFGGNRTKSKVVQDQDYLVINKSDVDILNNSIAESISNVIIDQAAACGQELGNVQEIILNLEGCNGCRFDDISNRVASVLVFDCEQYIDTKINIVNRIDNQVATALSNSNDNDLKAIMESNAENNLNLPMFQINPTSIDNEINQNIKFEVRNENYASIETIIHNIVVNNLTMSARADCISKLNNSQTIFVGIKDSRDVYIGTITQEIVNDVFVNCLQELTSVSDISNEIMQALGVVVDNSNKTKAVGSQSGKATNSLTVKGLFEQLFGSGKAISIVSSIIICIICIIVIISVVFLSKKAIEDPDIKKAAIDFASKAAFS